MNSILAAAPAYWMGEPPSLCYRELLSGRTTTLAFFPSATAKPYDRAMDELLRIHSLTVELPTAAGWVRPVDDVSLRIALGEALGLVGESGSGKTMLALALMGLLPPGARVSGEAFLSAADAQRKSLANLSEPE